MSALKIFSYKYITYFEYIYSSTCLSPIILLCHHSLNTTFMPCMSDFMYACVYECMYVLFVYIKSRIHKLEKIGNNSLSKWFIC